MLKTSQIQHEYQGMENAFLLLDLTLKCINGIKTLSLRLTFAGVGVPAPLRVDGVFGVVTGFAFDLGVEGLLLF